MKVFALFLLVAGSSHLFAQSGAKAGEWPTYGGDRQHPLLGVDQINAENFNKLEVAWRFKTDSVGHNNLEATPLMVSGVIYTTAGSRRDVVALDAATGEMIWMHSERKARAATARRGSFPAAASRTGPTAGRANPLRDARLPADRAGREDGRRMPVRQRTASSI